MSKWQPIETAPKDGTDILLMDNKAPGLPTGKADKCWCGNTAVGGWWEDENGGKGAWICYMDAPLDPEVHFDPTHWMFLPDPPKETQ